MKHQKHSAKRTVLITVSCLLAAVILVGGILVAVRSNMLQNAVVDVQQVMSVSTTYWGDESSSSGVAQSDFVQELYPDTDTAISEIFVKEGQSVKIGDVLLQYDTERVELDVESKRLDVEKQEYELDQARKELVRLQNAKPYVEPTEPPSPPPTPTPTPVPESKAELYQKLSAYAKPFAGTGTSDDPYVFLCTEDCRLTSGFLTRLLGLRKATPTPLPTPDPTPEPTPEPTSEPTPDPTESPSPEPTTNPTESPSPEPTAEPTESPSPEPTVDPTASPSPEPTADPTESPSPEPTAEPSENPTESPGANPTDAPETAPAEEVSSLSYKQNTGKSTAKPTPTPKPDFILPDGPFAVRLEVHEENNENLPLIKGWAMNGIDLRANFLVSEFTDLIDGTGEISPTYLSGEYEGGSGGGGGGSDYDNLYTAEELREMIREKQQEIRDLELAVKQAELDLKKAELELSNLTVTATVNGTVRTLIDLETAEASGSPFLVVSGGSGFYVTGSLNESLIGRVTVGDTVTVNSWETGGTYSAEIVQISDFPSNSYYSYSENPNTSNYAFTAYISDAEGLKNGMWLDIILQAGADAESTDKLYIMRAYLRTDDTGRYVLKAGSDHRVHKEYVETGKTIYNEYIEIKSDNLLPEDYIAFPYGTDAVDGARIDPEDDISLNDSESGVIAE